LKKPAWWDGGSRHWRPPDIRDTIDAMGTIFTLLGFAIGAAVGIGSLTLALGGEQHDELMKRPWVRMGSGLYVIACSLLVAFVVRQFVD
jgi:hypothetical protein